MLMEGGGGWEKGIGQLGSEGQRPANSASSSDVVGVDVKWTPDAILVGPPTLPRSPL